MFIYANCISFLAVLLGFLRSKSVIFSDEKANVIKRDAIMTGLIAIPGITVMVADASTADLGLVLMIASMMAFFVNAAMENKWATIFNFVISVSSAGLMQYGII